MITFEFTSTRTKAKNTLHVKVFDTGKWGLLAHGKSHYVNRPWEAYWYCEAINDAARQLCHYIKADQREKFLKEVRMTQDRDEAKAVILKYLDESPLLNSKVQKED